MNLLRMEDLRDLIEAQPGPCVSLFMPTYRTHPEQQQNPIRFKNLLADAAAQLDSGGLRAGEIDALLQPARQLLADSPFWARQRDGFALFAGRKLFRYYRLPIPVPEQVGVGDHFDVRSLLPLVTTDGEFYVLALSQKQARLAQCSRQHADWVENGGWPLNLEELAAPARESQPLQLHTTTPTGTGRGAPIYHGQGPGAEDQKQQLLGSLREVDRRVTGLLKTERVPLAVAAVDYLFGLYKQVNRHSFLLDDHIAGNPDGLSPAELQARAWDLARPLFERKRAEAFGRYRRLAGAGQPAACADPHKIVPAAHHGRVEVLLLAECARMPGLFRPETGEVLADPSAPGARDLLNMAAVQTLLQGGEVYVLTPDQMPDGASVAAILRY
jgi:hypothetical protein